MVGTFIGIRPTSESERDLRNFIKSLGLPDPKFDLHVTVALHKTLTLNIPTRSIEIYPEIQGFDLFGPEKNCLVLKLNSPELEARHEELRARYQLPWDYEDYQPHLTLSYDFKGELPELPDFQIVLKNEYLEDFNTDCIVISKSLPRFLKSKDLSPNDIAKKHGVPVGVIQKEFALGMADLKNIKDYNERTLRVLLSINDNLKAFSSVKSEEREQQHQSKIKTAKPNADISVYHELDQDTKDRINNSSEFKRFEELIGAPYLVHPVSDKSVLKYPELGTIVATVKAQNIKTHKTYRFTATVLDHELICAITEA